jgi:outer membrane usher protein FimD/PapC
MDSQGQRKRSLQKHISGAIILYSTIAPVFNVYAGDIQFNTDVLDVKDRANIDLKQFSKAGYILPGDYIMAVKLNQQELSERNIKFVVPENDPKGSMACLSPELVEQIALKASLKNQLVWMNDGQCLDLSSLKGVTAKGDLGTGVLYVSTPQAYLEYTADNWDPPSRWDEGIPGVLLDYNLNAQMQRQQKTGHNSNSLTGNGVVGTNLGAWRVRADWQARADNQSKSGGSAKSLDWTRYYAYRAIKRLEAKFILGENYLNSDLFDSFRFAGASLATDDNMLPPNLRGYAPEVTGIARTNAKVVISQQGRVIYESQVAAGPFRIQDLNDAVSGQLEVRVEEQDGSVQNFKLDTATIPYLTRPGMLRYKVSAGRPTDWAHKINGPVFTTGEFSYGINNGWSAYGGAIVGSDYNAAAIGIGRDLTVLGALSFDVTQSRASLPNAGEALSGRSYRLSYSKRFDEYNSQVTFAGYRFSEKNYLSMVDFLDAKQNGIRTQNNKEMYTISLNKQFTDLGLSAYLNYYHQTYWDLPANDRYNLTLSKYLDIGRLRNISLSLSAYRNTYNGVNDDGMYLSLSLPWGTSGSVSYNGSVDRSGNSHQAAYYDRLNERDSYQISSGVADSAMTVNGYFNHQGDLAQMSASAAYRSDSYSSLSLGLQGGMTATAQGAALHRSGIQGGTRMLLDTDGVANIPMRGYGATTKTNRFGKAVVADVSSYYRNRVSIDLNNLPDNAEAGRSVVQSSLTEGAIGYRRFEVVAGEKAMAVLRLADGTTPPFGATVLNSKKQEVGIVDDGGNVYLSGIKANERMTVHWDGKAQCALELPPLLPNRGMAELLLPCRALTETNTLKGQ